MGNYPTDQEIWELARQNGLDPYPVYFELVPASALYEFAAYLIPGRMSHWSYGKAYHLMKTRYDYGLNKLYEMVINSNPAYGFLLESNSELENTFVKAHVMGHVDFFHRNHCFWHTSEDMIEQVARHADRVRHYEFLYGRTKVEKTLDAVLALQNHVRWPSPKYQLPRDTGGIPDERRQVDQWDDIGSNKEPHVHAVKPEIALTDDLLRFLAERSTVLEEWQQDVVNMVHDEMVYFWPQIRTKIMNEGWASFWHVELMRQMPLSDDDYVNFARLHSSVIAPLTYQLNPYSVGYHIFRRIYETEGMDGAFLAREVNDDLSFIRNYLTQDLAQELNLYVYGPQNDEIVVKDREWKVVKQQLIQDLTHGGIPIIDVNDDNFNHRQELYLVHRHEGTDLDLPYAEHTLQYVYQLWGKTVHLETVSDHRRIVLTFDGHVNTKVVL